MSTDIPRAWLHARISLPGNESSSPPQDQFDDYRESTIGAAFLTQTISLDESTTVKFEIWDTAGQERYKSLAPMYYRNANCAVVVYDITQAVCLLNPSNGVGAVDRSLMEQSGTVIVGQGQVVGEGTPASSEREHCHRSGGQQVGSRHGAAGQACDPDGRCRGLCPRGRPALL